MFFRYLGQSFVWDAAKAASNVSKHGISFATACEVFLDPFIRLEGADAEEERRAAAFGLTEDRTMLCIVHVVREDEIVRLISARPATAQERRRYEDGE